MISTKKVYTLLVSLFLFVNCQFTLSSMDVTVTPIDNSVATDVFLYTEIPTNVPTFETSPSKHTTRDGLNETTSPDLDSGTNSSLEMKDEETQTEEQTLTTTLMNAATPYECNQTGGSFLRAPVISNCSNYYEICTNESVLSSTLQLQAHQLSSNSTRVKSCGNGTLFDSISAQCKEKSNAYCEPYKCAEPDGFFHDPTSRYTFIHCFDSVPYRKSCEPKGTVFFNDTKVCMWAPDELPLGLRLFRTFVWFVNFTEPTLSSDFPYMKSDGYIKMGIVAVLIPLLYILTVLIWYKVFYRPERSRRGVSRYSSNNTDFHHCYYRRPSRYSGAADFHSMNHQTANNPLNDSYFVTSNF